MTTFNRLAAYLAAASLTCATALALVAPSGDTARAAASVAPAESAQDGRPDLVVIRGRRDAETPVTGTLVEARLDTVIIQVDKDNTSYKHDKVVRIQLNRVPETFADGRKHMGARRFKEAADAFGRAAGDSKQSPVVRSAAILEAIAAEVSLSATEPAALGRARELAARYLREYPQARDLPEARRWSARLAHLAGDTAAAIDGYAALFGEFDGTKLSVGYQALDCLEAGLVAGHTALASGDTTRGRDLFAALEKASTAFVASLEPTDRRNVGADALRERAQLGEGWILLAGNKGTQARSFFKSRAEGDQLRTEQARSEARLGLAQSLESSGEHREAQIQYAMVSSTTHGDRDLVARALVGLAATTTALGDTGGRALARTWLTEVIERYPDTPVAGKARAELEKLEA